MPGIYGYIKKDKEDNQLENMTKILNHQQHFIKEDDFVDENFSSSHIHLGNFKTTKDMFFKDGIYISIEGEQYDYENTSFVELVFESYIENCLDIFLNKLDGYFNAVIYDSNLKKLFLISDRYGMRMLYFYYKDGNFAFSSEVKGLLALDFVDKEIDPNQIDVFMDLGYLLEDNTWHKHIKLIKPATILEFDIDTKELNHRYYWKWSEIKPSNLSFDEAVDKLGELWLKAVEKRFNPNEKIGISLSGGLDSRAIFAAVNTLYPDSEGIAYTFGIPNCDDIKIAKQCVSQTKWKHKEFYFTSDNWFEPRKDSRVWFSDGMKSIRHMHGSEFSEEIRKNNSIIIGGVFGDIILRFSSLQDKDDVHNKRINKELSKLFYKNYSSKDFIMDDFYDIKNCEPFLLMNDGRRFSNMGVLNVSDKFSMRLPFFDNKLIEFIYSINDEYRKDNKLYSSMLLKKFPKFFQTIPWSNTGKIVGASNNLSKLKKLLNKIKRIPYKFGLLNDKEFVDYPKWISEKKVNNTLKKLLNYNGSLYSKYTDRNFKIEYLDKNFIRFRKYDEKILRAATIEIYLQKLNDLEKK